MRPCDTDVAAVTTPPGSLFSALDLPSEAQDLQDAYWKAKHEWERLDAAYHLALDDLLKRLRQDAWPQGPPIRDDSEIPA